MNTVNSKMIDVLTIMLYASLFLISSESFNGQLISLAAAVISIAIVAVDAFHCKGKIKLQVTSMHIWMVLFILFCCISSIWALQPGLAISKGNTIVKNCICIVLIYFHYQKEKSVKHLLKVVMYGGYAVVLLAVGFWGLDALLDLVAFSTRMTNSFINQNTLGMLAAFTVLINMYFVLYYKAEKKGIFLAIVSLVVLAAAGSRKSILELIIAMLILFTLKNYNGKQQVKSFFKIIGVIVLLIVVFIWLSRLPMFDFVNTRLQNVLHQLTGLGYTDYSVRSRALMNSLGWKLFKESPILGLGIDCARIPTQQLTGKDWYLHNNYLELLVDGGVVGCILYYSIFVIMLRRFRKYRKYRDAEFDICLALMIVQLILEYAYVAYYSRETYFYIMLYFLETEILKHKYVNNKQPYMVK